MESWIAPAALVALALATGTLLAAEANVPGDETARGLYDPRTKSPMDELASPEDVAKFIADLDADWTLLVEDRSHSIRKTTGLPKRWLSDLPAHTRTFKGKAQPGEFYVFQVGVFAAKSAIGELTVQFGDLTGTGPAIAATNLRCFNLGGVDFLGRPFNKAMRVEQGKLQALWIGVDVPRSAAGVYKGTVTVKDATSGVSQTIGIKLTVVGKVLNDHGDSDSWRLSRLRWLDSTIGLDDNVVTKPFLPITRKADAMKILGRELALAPTGLPGQIRSFFNTGNTAIEDRPTRQVLASPFHFVVETDDGPVAFTPARTTFTRELKGAVSWRTVSRVKDIELVVSGLLEYDGFVDCRCRITSARPIKVKDIRLEMDVDAGAATYFMGLGQKGGKSPASVDWKWNADVNQDGFWLGAVNGGFKLQLYGDNWRTPLINCYYHFRELNIPESWGGANGKSGGIRLTRSDTGDVRASAYSGPRKLETHKPLNFNFRLFLTPFKPLDTAQQWAMRYFHRNKNAGTADSVKAAGANVINYHQSTQENPTINYPYFDLSMPLLKKAVADTHAKDIKAKIYYTTREITNNLPELFAFWSMNGEIICASPGKDGKNARPLTNRRGPHPWLIEHLGETGYIPAWRDVLRGRYKGMLDLAVITTPDSRLDNFYCEGLAFTLRETGFDGVYVDDTALGRKAFQRAHRIFEAAGKPLLADMHSWSHWNPTAGKTPSAYCYMQNFPYYHRLWYGEGFNYNTPPDYWLVEMSGIPFGLMSEMLNGGGNKWRGMLFGMTQRLGWSGDPRPLWKLWDKFGMQNTNMLGWWDPACPVKTDNPQVRATVYTKAGKSLIALASWAPAKTAVRLTVDWKALGLDPARTTIKAPAIDGFQNEAAFATDGETPVGPGRGWLLIAEETPGGKK